MHSKCATLRRTDPCSLFIYVKILVLHQGRLVESGTHKELVERASGHYRQLYEAQVEGMIPMSGATRKTGSGKQS